MNSILDHFVSTFVAVHYHFACMPMHAHAKLHDTEENDKITGAVSITFPVIYSMRHRGVIKVIKGL